ncbi:hypothetical protein [Dokdonia sp. Hel_I_53]|uniref:hypothetical protein n=1 Tax=Dokdonia sp. Hel_I_53 TaxID=1566287 RepID=UPI0011A25475|nr:hypothetical protein [Dokdonia sp. Hel_I_53]
MYTLLSCGATPKTSPKNQKVVTIFIENTLNDLESFQPDRKVEVVLNANERLKDFIEVLDQNHPNYLHYVNTFSASIMEHLIASKQTLQSQIENLEVIDCENITENEEKYICYNSLEEYHKIERKAYDLLKKPYIYIAQPLFSNNRKYSLHVYTTGGEGYSQLSLAIFNKGEDGIWVLETRRYLAF